MKLRRPAFLVLLLALGAQLAVPAAVVSAATTSMGATATFLSAIVLTPTNMQFGNITFGGVPGASDTVTLTTAGAISFGGSNFASGGGTVAAGDVAITGSDGNVLNVSCDTSGVLAQTSGSGRITVDNVKVADMATASSGGVACLGVGTTALSFTLAAGTDDHLKMGGMIDGSTQVSFAAGAYSTANAGGAAINVDVVYQ